MAELVDYHMSLSIGMFILSNFIVIQLSMITSIYTLNNSIYTLNNLPITVYLIAYQDMYLIWVYKNTDSRLDTFNR